MSCPPIEHNRAPINCPRHRPCPAPDTPHPRAGRALPDALQHRADAHFNEERATAELRPTPDTPHANPVQHGGQAKRAKERARPPKERTGGARAKHDEDVPEGLVPAGTPEIGDRGRHPRARGERGPVRGELPKEHAADERRDMILHLDGRV